MGLDILKKFQTTWLDFLSLTYYSSIPFFFFTRLLTTRYFFDSHAEELSCIDIYAARTAFKVVHPFNVPTNEPTDVENFSLCRA